MHFQILCSASQSAQFEFVQINDEQLWHSVYCGYVADTRFVLPQIAQANLVVLFILFLKKSGNGREKKQEKTSIEKSPMDEESKRIKSGRCQETINFYFHETFIFFDRQRQKRHSWRSESSACRKSQDEN